jgi:hypothetical protein
MVELSSSEIYLRTNLTAVECNNLSITWNADNANENGVVVYLSWTGSIVGVHPNDQTNTEQVDRAVKFDDTGHGVIPANLFDGVPSKANVTLFIIRSTAYVYIFPATILSFPNKSFTNFTSVNPFFSNNATVCCPKS